MENIKKHIENMRRTNIYLIRPPQGENGDNRAKRQHVERNNGYELPDLMKNMNPQIHDVQHISKTE